MRLGVVDVKAIVPILSDRMSTQNANERDTVIKEQE